MMKEAMTALERRAVAALAGIFSLRMFGLFMILPVFSVYAQGLEGTTPLLMGVALGAYGLTQALFQIPFGMASDRWGRKRVIVAGLLIFAAGSVVAAGADSIMGVIVGRAVQGLGAIAAVVIALTADLTRERQRTKAMAVVGITIGATFLVSLMIGPLLDQWIGVVGMFWLTGVLAVAGIGVVMLLVPSPVSAAARHGVLSVPAQFGRVLRDRTLQGLDFGIFCLHLVLMALFVVLPLAFVDAGVPLNQHGQIYLLVILLSLLVMVPLIILSNRPGWTRRVLAAGVTLLLVAQGMWWAGDRGPWALALALWVFFSGFNLLEALLPSLVSRVAPAGSKGTAIGVYSSAEFFGAFAGGVLGGGLYGAFGLGAVFLLSAGVLALWLALVLLRPVPTLLDSRQLRVGRQDPEQARILAQRLAGLPGVAEAVVIAEEGIAYLKVDRQAVDDTALEAFVMVPSTG